jgi:hypothetical protein
LKYPGCAFFNYPPFNTAQFSAFACSAAQTIKAAEQESHHQLSRLPEHVASTFQGVVTTNNIQQEQLRLEMQQQYAGVQTQLEAVGSLLHMVLVNSNSRQRRKFASPGVSYQSSC